MTSISLNLNLTTDDKPALAAAARFFAELAELPVPARHSELGDRIHYASETSSTTASASDISLTVAPEADDAPSAIPAPAVDAKGLPWDARIHSSSRALNADGTWRAKRGVSPQAVTAVEAELHALMAIPVPAAEPVVAPPPLAAEPVVAPPPLAAEPVVAPPSTFIEIMNYANRKIAHGEMTHDRFIAACQAVGVTAVPLLATRPDLIPAVYRELTK